MNKPDGQDKAGHLSAIVANSLDAPAKTQDLARQAFQSRTQFHRLFRTMIAETPAAMRRRLLLERAAYQLGHTGMSVTDIALDANYNSLEAFTRAFRKAFLPAHAWPALPPARVQQHPLSCPRFRNNWFPNQRRK